MADPLIDDVVLLCHFDGTNGSTTFIDSSPSPKTLTAVGTAALSTTQSKWGGASLRLDGSGARATVPATADFGFATRLWTVEAWIRLDSASVGTQTIVEFLVSPTQRLMCQINAGEIVFDDGDEAFFSTTSGIADATWAHVAWCFDGTNIRAFVDGVVKWTNGFSRNLGASMSLTIGSDSGATWPVLGYVDDLRVTIDQARYTAGFTPPTGAFDDPVSVSYDARISAASPLGALLARGAITGQVRLSIPSPVGTLLATARTFSAFLSSDGPLGSFRSAIWHDFTGQLGDTITRYFLDLTTPGGIVRAPISSWQATLRTDGKCYVQCVVPACAPYVDDITAATAFSIKRRAVLPDESAFEYEMAAAPDPSFSLAQGPFNYSATITAYADAFAEDEDPPAGYDRTLVDIRSLTTTPTSLRARCAIDWLLRPGHRAIVTDSLSIVVGWINYYVNENDQFMDVGNRT